MPQAEIQRRQAALERERHKLSYAPGPGGFSELADAALSNLLRYGAGLTANVSDQQGTARAPPAAPPAAE